ncbi:unnamed protein product, partial [Rotaria magnacalcarata]
VCISELERSRITVEEVKPLLHDEVQFHHGNCTIHFTSNDDDDEETNIPVRQIDRSQLNSVNNHAVIRTT